jgi:predicted RNase H-like HicB family nuclease
VNVDDLHYSILIQWSEEDQVYLATVPELSGCITHGKTYKKALKQVKYAMEGWIEANQAIGQPIPAPRLAVLPDL